MSADSDEPRDKPPRLRDERLASALRANLQRRKAQARARAGRELGPEEPGGSHDSAGIVADKPAR